MTKTTFISDFEAALALNFQIEIQILGYQLPVFVNNKLQIVLIEQNIEPEFQNKIIDWRENDYPKLLVIFKNQWYLKKTIILQKIAVMMGKHQLLHGRKCLVKEVSSDESLYFLNQYHILGATKSEHRFGLYFENKLVALSIWGKVRFMKYENPPYYSAELIKFASLPNISIAGGLSKLIAHFQQLYHCKTIMTYADINWYTGNTFENIGFDKINIITPSNNMNDSLGSIKFVKTF